jgi:hypothetical protein
VLVSFTHGFVAAAVVAVVMSFVTLAVVARLPLHLATPERAETLARLEIPEPHRHFQMLIISPEAQVGLAALVATLEAMPALHLKDLTRSDLREDRVTRVVLLLLLLKGRAARRVEGQAPEELAVVLVAAAVGVLGSPMPVSVSVVLGVVARVEPQVEEPVAMVARVEDQATTPQHLVYRGQVVAEVEEPPLVIS